MIGFLTICVWTLFFVINLFRSLYQDTPEGFDDGDPEVERTVWWQIFGPLIAIIILNVGGIVLYFIMR